MRRLPFLMVWSGLLLLSCVPGKPFQIQKSKTSSADGKPLGSDAIPVDPETKTPIPPDDPEEEEKAMEPAIIGGAYLYCDADEGKAGDAKPMAVGCRVGNVSELDWAAASKSATVTHIADGTPAECALTIPLPGSPYHVVFDANRSLQNGIELNMDIVLPQGALIMTTTINPGSVRAIEQRIGPGLALYASTGTAGDWPGIDRKTWNLWIPLKIPQAVKGYSDSSGPGPGGSRGSVELAFDDTICTYKPKDAKSDFNFVSCTKPWLPDQWVRSKSLSLKVIGEGQGPRGSLSAGVVLQTEP